MATFLWGGTAALQTARPPDALSVCNAGVYRTTQSDLVVQDTERSPHLEPDLARAGQPGPHRAILLPMNTDLLAEALKT